MGTKKIMKIIKSNLKNSRNPLIYLYLFVISVIMVRNNDRIGKSVYYPVYVCIQINGKGERLLIQYLRDSIPDLTQLTA